MGLSAGAEGGGEGSAGTGRRVLSLGRVFSGAGFVACGETESVISISIMNLGH